MTFSLDAIYHSASWAIYSHSSKLMELQEKAATGQDINRTSDNPIDANRVLDLRSQKRDLEQYISTLDESISIFELSSSVTQSLSEQLAQARESLTSVLSGVMNGLENASVRSALADDINNILEQVVTLGNTQRLGRHLFAGEDTDNPPYAVVRDANGDITQVNYQGSYQNRKVEVAPGVEMDTTIVGADLFVADERQAPQFMGTTGITAGSGTSSVRGDVWLTVAANGPNWDLSIDGGTTVVTVAPGSTNVPIVHASTGEVLYVDVPAAGVSAGEERVLVPGTYDMFNILINTRDMLKSQDKMTATQWHNIMEEMVTSLRDVDEKVTRAFPVLGGKVGTLNNFRTSIDDIKFNTEEEISRLQDADIAKVALDLSRYELLYQMSLEAASTMFDMNLLNYL